MGKWFSFEGTHWRYDDTRLAYDKSRKFCRGEAASCNKRKLSTALASSKVVNAMVNLCSADRRIAATSDQWDSDLWLLNTPDGVVDLRTGDLRPHRPLDYMTKLTGRAEDITSDSDLEQVPRTHNQQ
jgi:putative DNA primase/helicase